MLETEEASDSHDEEIRGPVSGLCHRRLPGNRPHGWNMESSALEWKTVGVGGTGWTYRFNWCMGMESLESETWVTHHCPYSGTLHRF